MSPPQPPSFASLFHTLLALGFKLQTLQILFTDSRPYDSLTREKKRLMNHFTHQVFQSTMCGNPYVHTSSACSHTNWWLIHVVRGAWPVWASKWFVHPQFSLTWGRSEGCWSEDVSASSNSAAQRQRVSWRVNRDKESLNWVSKLTLEFWMTRSRLGYYTYSVS